MPISLPKVYRFLSRMLVMKISIKKDYAHVKSPHRHSNHPVSPRSWAPTKMEELPKNE